MPRLVTDGFHNAAIATPNKTAVVCGPSRLTYAELSARAVAVGVGKRAARRVAIAMPNDVALIEIFLGVIEAGAEVMIMDPLWPAPLMRAMQKAHAPHIVIATSEIAAALDSGAAEIVALPDYSAWRDQPGAAGALKMQPTPDMPFLIGFTSGTGGRPKAFTRSHASWVDSFAASAIELGISASSRVLAPGPLSHGLTLYAATETLSAGGTVTLQTHFDADLTLRQIAAGEADTLVVVPTMLDLLAEAANIRTFAALATIITAGAKLSPKLRRRLEKIFPAARIIEYYGASELGFVTVSEPEAPPESVGRPFRGVEVEVRRQDGSRAPAGETGTVWVRSLFLCSGYLGEEDGVGFRRDGAGPASWATVGDHGYLDRRGYLHLVGRENDMLISAGHNIYPSEVERVLLACPGVAACAVIGLPDPRWGQIVAAVIVPQPSSNPEASVLREACAAAMPSYKVPRRWFVARGLPRTASGKVMAAALREHIAARDAILMELQ